MAIYLAAVHGWALWLPAVGEAPRDAGFWGSHLAALAADHLLAARLIQFALLYAFMVAVFFLTRAVTRGPWWLGSLAAVLTMAHPMKTEAIFVPGRASDLVLALAGAVALLGYTQIGKFDSWRSLAGFLCFLLPTLYFRDLMPVVLAAALYELLIEQEPEKRPQRVVLLWVGALGMLGAAPGLCMAYCIWPHKGYPGCFRAGAAVATVLLAALAVLGSTLGVKFHSWPYGRALDLPLVLYPIGVLPETALRFLAHPWLPAAIAAATALGAAALFAASRERAMLWGVLAAVLLRFAPQARGADPESFAGGGSMLLEISLIHIALAAVCGQIQRHPKWTRHIVALTSLWCLAYFALQIETLGRWRRAAAFEAALRAHVSEESEAFVVPRWDLCNRVPVSHPLWHKACCGGVRLKYADGLDVSVERAAPDHLVLECRGAAPEAVLPFPPGETPLWGPLDWHGAAWGEFGGTGLLQVEVSNVRASAFRLDVRLPPDDAATADVIAAPPAVLSPTLTAPAAASTMAE